MLEICFSESAGGILKAASGKGTAIGEVLCLPLLLNVGDISDIDNISLREPVYKEFFVETDYESVIKAGLDNIRYRLNHDDLRIWYSICPSEFCGLHFIMSYIEQSESPKRISGIQCQRLLPMIGSEKDFFKFSNLGESESAYVPQFLKYEEQFSSREITGLGMIWRALVRENAPLRAYVNGVIKSVDKDYYDAQILEHIPDKPVLAGRAISEFIFNAKKYIPYYLIRMRIKEMIKDGKVTLVHQGEPFFNSIIKR